MRVVHVITGMEVGGAEKVLLQVADRARDHGVEPVIVTLTGPGALSAEARRRKLEVIALDLRGRRLPLGFLRLVVLLRRLRPDLVQTWLYKADLIGGLASRLARRRGPVVWNVRQANIDADVNSRATVLAIGCCRRLSGIVPSAIVCVSEAAAVTHVAAGFDAAKLHIIPNGFDVERFRPDPEARAGVRRELGIPDGVTLVGIVGRVDPQKDHRTFAAAAGAVAHQVADVRFVLCGKGTEPGAQPLHGWLEEHGVVDRCHLLGVRDDVPRVLAALDVLVSSSSGEGFANVIGEGMASGLPCVVTAAGNSAELVGDAGAVVPTEDPGKLGDALLTVLELTGKERAQLGAAGRERVSTRWSIETCVERYASFWRAAAGSSR